MTERTAARHLGTTDKHTARKMETQTPLGARSIPVPSLQTGAPGLGCSAAGSSPPRRTGQLDRPSGLCPHRLLPRRTDPDHTSGVTESVHPRPPTAPSRCGAQLGPLFPERAPGTETHTGPETLPPETFSHCVLNPRRHTARRTYRHTTPCRAVQRQLLTGPAWATPRLRCITGTHWGGRGASAPAPAAALLLRAPQELAPNHPTGKMHGSVLNSKSFWLWCSFIPQVFPGGP